MATIVVVDLSAKFWAAWMSRKDSDPTSAPHDWTVHHVRKLAEEYRHVGIACDSKESWRRELYPLYKAQRNEREPAAWAQLEHTIETLRREGFPIWKVDGMEADDIAATVAYQAPRCEAPTHDVIIVSSDKDLLQCVRDPSVRVLTLGGPNSPPRIVTEATSSIGKGKDGGPLLVPPRLVRDFLALSGDGSDNVPGVKGIGPVKAMGLLAAYKSFPGVIAALEAEDATLMASQSGKLLAQHKDEATTSWRLVELRTDVDVDWSEALRERVPQAVPSPMRAASDADFEDAPQETSESAAVAELTPGREDAPDHLSPGRGSEEPGASRVIREGDLVHLSDAPARVTALATTAPWAMQLEPTNSGGAVKLAQYLADSRMFPALVTPEQCLAAILLGRVFGLPAVVACLNCTPIKGRMSMSSAMVLGIVRSHPSCEYIDGIDGDDKTCTWVAKRNGRPEVKHTFTMKEADRAGYTATRGGDGSWQKDPSGMLWLRTGTRIARRVFSDVIAGVYSAEEMEDV